MKDCICDVYVYVYVCVCEDLFKYTHIITKYKAGNNSSRSSSRAIESPFQLLCPLQLSGYKSNNVRLIP